MPNEAAEDTRTSITITDYNRDLSASEIDSREQTI